LCRVFESSSGTKWLLARCGISINEFDDYQSGWRNCLAARRANLHESTLLRVALAHDRVGLLRQTSIGKNLVQIGSGAKRDLAGRRRNPMERNTLPPMLKIA